jgi:hypothetical protein
MKLFKLTVTTLFARKTWVLAILAAIVLPFVLPYLTPYEGNVQLLQPARAQVAWSMAWLIAILWVFAQAAKQGEINSRTGIGDYFRSANVGRVSQLFQIWLAMMVYVLPVIVIAITVCLTIAMPGGSNEVGMWVMTNLQYAALFFLTVAPLTLLAVGLGSRFGALVGFVGPLALCLYGLYGVGFIRQMIRSRDNPMVEFIYTFSPHYHLANLTPRLVFKMGEYPAEVFGSLLVYFAGIMLVIGVVSSSVFRTAPLRS